MKGADALISTLVGSGVGVCFANPGTSEMHFVAALDHVPDFRAVLTLFEGVATGAADGYGRMAGHPAATLLHLGPGLGNGIANLHNARRARTPLINIIGDHATYHNRYDAPLQSDIEALAGNVSAGFIRRCRSPDQIGVDAAEAVRAAFGPPVQIATLILPADVSWSEGAEPSDRIRPATPRRPDADAVGEVARTLRSGAPAALLVGGRVCTSEMLANAFAVAEATGARVICETFPARMERGGGRPIPERLAYLPERAVAQLEGLDHLILIDTKSPVAFFAYPGLPSDLVPPGCQVRSLAGFDEDVAAALVDLVAAVDVRSALSTTGGGAVGNMKPPDLVDLADLATGALNVNSVCAVVAALLPEGAIVSEESITAGELVFNHLGAAAPHDLLSLTGGAIGQGLPVAVGAAVACPGRRVVALQADGSALYTLQSWWTMAREGLDVTTVVLANRSYAILEMELARVNAGVPGPRARELLELARPDIDFVGIAAGMGVPAVRAESVDEFISYLKRSFATPGPMVIEAVLADRRRS